MAILVLTDGNVRLGGGVVKLKELLQLSDMQGMEGRQEHKGDLQQGQIHCETQSAPCSPGCRQGGLREC